MADAKTKELSTSTTGEKKLAIEVEGNSSDVISAIKKIPSVIRVSKTQDLSDNTAKYLVDYDKESDIRREVFSAMSRINCPILDMQSGNETLEDMFLKLTSGVVRNGGNN